MTVELQNVLLFIFGVLVVFAAYPEGASSVPIGPRIPDAASGVSVDGQVYIDHREMVFHHGSEDGAAKYSHMGKDPKPAVVGGPPLLETKLKINLLGPGTLPEPADPIIVAKPQQLPDGWTSMETHDRLKKENPNEKSGQHAVNEFGRQWVHSNGEDITANTVGSAGYEAANSHETGNEDDGEFNDFDGGVELNSPVDSRQGNIGEEGGWYGQDGTGDEADDEEEGLKDQRKSLLVFIKTFTGGKRRVRPASRVLGKEMIIRADSIIKKPRYRDQPVARARDGVLQKLARAKQNARKQAKDVLTSGSSHLNKDDL